MSLSKSVSRLRVIKSGRGVAAVIDSADWHLLRAITEIAYNLVKGNLEVKRGLKSKLRAHGKLINTLADTSLKLEAKRQLLQRHKRKSAKVLTLMVRAIPWLSDSL